MRTQPCRHATAAAAAASDSRRWLGALGARQVVDGDRSVDEAHGEEIARLRVELDGERCYADVEVGRRVIASVSHPCFAR